MLAEDDMRTLGFAFLALLLAACTPPSSEDAGMPQAGLIPGQYVATSNTAMSITGDLDLSPNVLSFAKGFRVEGARIENALTGDTDLSAGGGTLTEGSGIAQFQTIELRRIETVRVAADARDPQLCGAGKTATYAILANGAETLSLQIFSGADAPGPNAHDTQLCGIFNYQPR
jgi:hypothetical protein